MNIRTRPAQISNEDDLIAGYRLIIDAASALGQDMPTLEMDSAILSAARGNSRRRRVRPVEYAAIAAGIVAVGLAISTSRDPTAPSARLDRDSTASPAPDPLMAQVQHDLRLWARNSTRNDAGLNGLVLNSPPGGAELRTASEVHTASELQTGGAVNTVAVQYSTVDLNQPEVLQRVARENPFHFAMIRRILAGVDTMPEQAVGRWMKSQFNATDVTYSSVMLTSDPPRKQLTFTLETTRYSALLTLTPAHRRRTRAR
jgi:hypothetical protein